MEPHCLGKPTDPGRRTKWFHRSDPSPPTATHFRSWLIASFRCAAESGRYRGIADSDNPSTRQNLWVHGLVYCDVDKRRSLDYAAPLGGFARDDGKASMPDSVGFYERIGMPRQPDAVWFKRSE
jgi:hypothetical protein